MDTVSSKNVQNQYEIIIAQFNILAIDRIGAIKKADRNPKSAPKRPFYGG